MPKKKYSQAARLHDIIRLLEARYGCTVDELAEECQVHRRTIHRDLRAVAEAGYPLVRDLTEEGRSLYRFMTRFKQIPPITFSLEELLTLYFCRGQLAFLQGTPFQEDLDAIFGRIRSSLPPRSVAHLERLAEAAAPRFQGLRDYAGQGEVLRGLRQALLYQYRCVIEYAPARRRAESYDFDPYTLLFYKDALYLGGFAHNRQALRLFLVDRIQSVEVGRERFEVPENFSPTQLTGNAFGLIDDAPLPVRVRFGPAVAHLIRERRWHPTQTLQEESDGALTLAFAAGGEKELLSWLYSYLPHVQVLEPPELAAAFYAGLQQGLAGRS
jgi:predicted DNA-binding transcriptional regulator YafY